MYRIMFRPHILIYLLLINLTFLSCEFNLSKENFVDLPPPENQIIKLDQIPAGDTLKIFRSTDLYFNLSETKLDIVSAQITFKNETIQLYDNRIRITINPNDYEPSIDTLTFDVYFHSGSSSIADVIGMEGYHLIKKWLILLDGRAAPELSPTYKINKDGLMLVEWTKCDQLNFLRYEITTNTSSGSIKKSIFNPHENYFIDSLYVGGKFSFDISCIAASKSSSASLYVNIDPPQLCLEELGFDSLRISWDKSPFDAKYRLSWSHRYLTLNSQIDTSCIIPQVGFGVNTTFELCTKSQHVDDWPGFSTSCNTSNSLDYTMGKFFMQGFFPYIGYSYINKEIYSNNYNYLYTFNNTNLALNNSFYIEHLASGGRYSCPTNSTKIALTTSKHIYIFDDNNFNNYRSIKDYSTWNNTRDHFLLTNNDIIAYAYKNIYKQIDVKSQQLIAELTIDDYPTENIWACISTSQDAKQLCIATYNGIIIYNIEDGKFIKIYSDSRNYKSAYFNPMNPNQLLLTLSEESGIEIRNPSDFSLINKIEIKNGLIISNIDPETNHILLTDYNYLWIVDLKSKNILLKVPSSIKRAWLYNSKLFSYSGYLMELSEYL